MGKIAEFANFLSVKAKPTAMPVSIAHVSNVSSLAPLLERQNTVCLGLVLTAFYTIGIFMHKYERHCNEDVKLHCLAASFHRLK